MMNAVRVGCLAYGRFTKRPYRYVVVVEYGRVDDLCDGCAPCARRVPGMADASRSVPTRTQPSL